MSKIEAEVSMEQEVCQTITLTLLVRWILNRGGAGLQCFYIPFGRQYAPHEAVPHEWFEWTSPSLQRGEPTYDTTADWSLGSTCYVDLSLSDEGMRPNAPATMFEVRKWPSMIQRMKGWLKKRRMSIP